MGRRWGIEKSIAAGAVGVKAPRRSGGGFAAGGFPDDPACGDGEGHRPQFVDRDVRAGGLALDAGRIEAEFAGIALGDLDAGGLVYEEVDIAALVAVPTTSISGSCPNSSAKILRTTAESSTMRTLVGIGSIAHR